MKRRLAFASAMAATVWCGAARADEPETVYLAATCLPEGVSAEALMTILRAELSPRSVSVLTAAPGDMGAGAVVLAVDRCTTTPPSVRIDVWFGAEHRQRAVVLSDVAPDEWTRTLALALAETRLDEGVSKPAPPSAPWEVNERAAPPALPAEAPHPSADPIRVVDRPPSEREREQPQALHFRGKLAFRYATETSTPAAGAFLGMEFRRLGAGASIFGARKSVSAGEITLWVPSATVYYVLAELTGPFRLWGALDVGAAVATGAPHAPTRSDTQASFHAALHAGVGATLWSGKANDVEAGLGVGYASSLRARANGADVVSLDGLLLTAEVGLAFH